MKRLLQITAILWIFMQPTSHFSQSIEDVINLTKSKLDTATSPKDKSILYGDLAWYYATISVDSSYKFGYKSLEFAKQSKNDSLIAQAYNDLGTVYYVKGDYKTSQEYCKKSYVIRKSQNDLKGLASLHVKMANNFNRMAQYDSSMYYYLKAHQYFEDQKDIHQQMNIESNISAAYYMMGNNEKAISYLEKPIQYYEETQAISLLSNAITNLGNIYYSNGDTINAMKAYKRAEKEALKVNNTYALGVVYNNLGEIHSKKNENKKAVDYIEKSIKVREESGLEADVASSYLTLAFNYFRIGDYNNAKENLIKIVPVFETSKSQEKLDDVYLLLSYIYALEGQTDSLSSYYTKFYEARSQNIRDQIISSTQDLETKYQTEKKENALIAARADLAERELRIQRKDNLIYGTVFFAIVIAVIGYLLFNQQKLKNRQLKRENELKEALHQIAVQNRLQEQRLQISRDLHDNIGAQLTFIISSIDNLIYGLQVGNNDNLADKLKNISHFTSSTIIELRDTIWAMNKASISFEDFVARLSNYIEKVERLSSKVKFEFIIDEDTCLQHRFSSVQGMNIYRIIQESVQNALKHAKTALIQIKVKEEKDTLLITIL
ncbi:MAG TPA: tetratricopeptide repeat protein, partial [Flavobacteriaceae bacterium]|nr:tetratricopeptide repeat protein [Flavobacteriaceae bacterium]